MTNSVLAYLKVLPEGSEFIAGVGEGPDPGSVSCVHVMHEDDDQAQHVDDQHAAHVDGGRGGCAGVNCFKFCGKRANCDIL